MGPLIHELRGDPVHVLRAALGLLATLAACTSSAPTLIDANLVAADTGPSAEAWIGPDMRPPPPSLTCAEARLRYPNPTRITTALAHQALIPDDLSEVLLVEDKSWTLDSFVLSSGKLWRLPTHQVMGPRLVLGGQAILYTGWAEHEGYELALHRRATGYRKEILIKDCGDPALDSSGRWIAFRHWTKQHTLLIRTDLRRSSSQTLTEGPDSGEPVVGPKGDVVRPINHWIPGCSFKTERLVIYRHDGPEVRVDGLVVKRSAAWAGERLLWREYESCAAAAKERLMTLSVGGQPTTLAIGRRFDDGKVEDAPYAVTSDDRWVLASGAEPGLPKQTLYAIATDGSGEKILARDLVSFDAREAWTTPIYRATADARYAVYAAFDSSLRAVRLAGGRGEVLATSLRPYKFYVAPAGDAVVYVTGPRHNLGSGNLRVTRPGGEPLHLHKLGKWIRLTRLQFAADAATFHFITQSSDRASTLHRAGVDSSVRLLMSYFTGMTISTDGCLLVFRPAEYSSLAQGTYLWAPN